MENLIKALQIFLKYKNLEDPTFCTRDYLHIRDVSPSEVSVEDKEELDRLGFFVSEEDGEEDFRSFHFGCI